MMRVGVRRKERGGSKIRLKDISPDLITVAFTCFIFWKEIKTEELGVVERPLGRQLKGLGSKSRLQPLLAVSVSLKPQFLYL